jgi:hypothetical protein
VDRHIDIEIRYKILRLEIPKLVLTFKDCMAGHVYISCWLVMNGPGQRVRPLCKDIWSLLSLVNVNVRSRDSYQLCASYCSHRSGGLLIKWLWISGGVNCLSWDSRLHGTWVYVGLALAWFNLNLCCQWMLVL